MGEYLVSNITYPATQYEPTESPPTGAPVYHEDREVTLSATTGSQMFRTYNAQFNPNTAEWGFPEGSSAPAYATVQNPDGSIHYFTNPPDVTTWTTWAGTGNNAVYNAVDFGLVVGSGSQPQTLRAANVAALQNAIDAAITAKGGTVVIPAGTYELGGITDEFTATINIANVNGGLTIRGESAGTTLVQYGTPQTMGANLAADIFDVSNSGNPTQFGLRFRELTLQYANDLSLPTTGAVAINCVSDVADTTAEYCAFLNCPQAFAAGSSGSAAHCGLIGCTVSQDLNGYSSSTQVLLSGPEAFVLYSDLYQKPMTEGGPTGNTGIAVQNSAEGCRIYGCHISDFYTGISVAQGSVFTYITDCEVDAAAGLTIGPADNTGKIYGVFVTACKFGMIKGYTPFTPTSGILINDAGGQNPNIEGIFIADCLVYGFPNAGLQIIAGQSITVVGGKYSSNGQAPLLPIDGAGIAITGSPAQVRIVGADCSGLFDFWIGTTQPYGVSVSLGTNLSINGCDLTNNATAALYVPSNGTDLRVTNCLGYNDQGTIVTATAPANNANFNGGTLGYYGPVTFYTIGTLMAPISAIKIQGNTTNLVSGTFTLAPGPTPNATISYSSITGAKQDFLMAGQ
jgi:hypothetical protein